MSSIPNCDLLSKHGDEISALLCFLDDCPYRLCGVEGEQWYPVSQREVQNLVYKQYGIDPDKLEEERRSLVEALQKQLPLDLEA